jgi:hypothetical protein
VRSGGLLLFGGHESPASAALTDELRALHGRERTFICIDQEGGRVARMKSPEWLAFPPGAVFDRLYDLAPASAIAAARANAQALGLDLAERDQVDAYRCSMSGSPAHDVIGDRALGQAAARGGAGPAVLEGLAAEQRGRQAHARPRSRQADSTGAAHRHAQRRGTGGGLARLDAGRPGSDDRICSRPGCGTRNPIATVSGIIRRRSALPGCC